MASATAPAPAKTLSLRQLLTKTFPPGNAIIEEGILPQNGLLVIGGAPKAYKSFVLGSLLYHCLIARPLFEAHRFPHGRGRSGIPAFNIPKRQRVVLFEQEVGEFDLKARYEAFVARLPQEEREYIKDNLFIHSCDSDVRLDTPEGREYIQQIVGDLKPTIVAFDPLVEFHMKDENSTRDMAHVLWGVTELRNRFGIATIMTHHTGKPNDNGRSGADLLRGNSVIYGKGDAFMMLRVLNRTAGKINIGFTVRRAKPINDIIVLLDWEELRAKFHKWTSESTGQERTEDMLLQ